MHLVESSASANFVSVLIAAVIVAPVSVLVSIIIDIAVVVNIVSSITLAVDIGLLGSVAEVFVFRLIVTPATLMGSTFPRQMCLCFKQSRS